MSYENYLVKPEDIEKGLAIYVVTELGTNSFLRTLLVDGVCKEDERFINVHQRVEAFYPFHTYKMSLRDCVIIPNTYNQHKSFLLLSAAKEYLAECKRVS